MAMIRQDFTVSFELNKIGSIKAWKETKVDGVTYPPSVKFRGINMEEKEDADVGVREIETIIDFQVVTKTLDEAKHLVEALRKKRTNNEKVSILGNLPRKEGADEILKIKSIETLEAFLSRNKISLK